MSITNQGLFENEFYQGQGLDGRLGAGAKTRAAILPLRTQVETVTVGGTATDGDYVIIVAPTGGGSTYRVVYARSAGDNAAIRTALVSAVNDHAVGTLVTAAASSGNTLTLTAKSEGIAYTVTYEAPSPGTLTGTTTTAPGGRSVALARFVHLDTTITSGISGDALPIRELTTADATASRQFMYLPTSDVEGEYTGDGTLENGRVLSAVYEGMVHVTNTGTVDAVFGGGIHVVRNSAGGGAVGTVRSNADGTNTTLLGSDLAYWYSARTKPGQVGLVMFRG